MGKLPRVAHAASEEAQEAETLRERGMGYETDRLRVCGWHSVGVDEFHLAEAVCALLTPPVLEGLPDEWRVEYDLQRASRWIEQRDREGQVFLALIKADGTPIGLVFVHESESGDDTRVDVRLGYLLGESAWGQGYATELVRGFVDMCRRRSVSSIAAGVTKGNSASRGVLEKNGFVRSPDESPAGTEDFFVLSLQPRPDAS